MHRPLRTHLAAILTFTMLGTSATAAPMVPQSPRPEMPDQAELLARIECHGWRKALHAEALEHEIARRPYEWSHTRDKHFKILQRLTDFERERIHPFIDPESQSFLIETHWPEFVAPKDAATRDRRQRCRAVFADF